MKRSVSRTAAATPDLPEVSPGNPCPFLRGLVAAGSLDDHEEPLSKLAKVVAEASAGPGEARLPTLAIGAIALVANGLSPLSLAQRLLGGVRLDGLRNGPLDKKGRARASWTRRARWTCPSSRGWVSSPAPRPTPRAEPNWAWTPGNCAR